MSEDERIPEILGTWYQDRRKGDDSAREDLLRENPELAEELREHFGAMDAIVESFSGSGGTEAVGREFGDYRITRELGRGGMGVVYEAEQISLRRKVALKILSMTFTASDQALKRFRREAQAAARLHHTNIVPVYALGEQEGFWYYAMELVEGRPLSAVISAMQGLKGEPEPAARSSDPTGESSGLAGSDTGERSYYVRLAETFAGVADALELAHRDSVIHRDIKPANLLLDNDGTLKVVDFGLARLEGDGPSMTLTGDLLGTPTYMSPEQAMAKRMDIDHRTDIYSLGATIYEVLTLRPPFKGRTLQEVCSQIITKDPALPRRANGRIPRDLETVVLKAMEKDRDKRYRTAADLARDLRRFADGAAIHARRIGPVGRAWRKVKRHKLRSGLVAAVAVLATAAAILAWSGAREAQRLRDTEYLRLCAEAALATGRSRSLLVDTEFEAQMRPGESTRDILGRAITLAPDRPEAYRLRALAPGRTPDERLADLDAARARGGLTPRGFHLARAAMLAHAGRWPESEREQRRAAAAGPATSLDQYLLGTLLERQGRNGEAIEMLTNALDDPDLPRPARLSALSVRVSLHMRLERWDGALQDLLSGRALGSDGLKTRLYLVLIWRELDQDHAADELLDEILGTLEGENLASAWRLYATLLATRTRRLPEALKAIEASIEIAPSDPAAWSRRGLILCYSGRKEEGLRSCERAIELAPNTPHPLAAYGTVLMECGRLGEAVEVLGRVLESDHRLVGLHDTYGVALTKVGRYEEALAAFDSAIRNGGFFTHPRSRRVWTLNQMGRYEEAVQAFAEAERHGAPTTNAIVDLGIAHYHLGRRAEAMEAFERAIARNEPNWRPYFMKATLLWEEGRFEDALRVLDRAVELSPRRALLHEVRGVYLHKLARFDQALESFDREIGIDSNRATGHLNRSYSLASLGRYEEALQAVHRAIDLEANRAASHEQLAIVLMDLRRPEEALQACDRATELDPGNAGYHSRRSSILDDLGRYEEALGAIDRALALDPEHRIALANRGGALRRLGRTDEALQAYDRALALEPDDSFCHVRRAEVLLDLGRPDEALQAYDRAHELAPDDAGILASRGEKLIACRRYEDALKAYDRALAIDPKGAHLHEDRGTVLLLLKRYDEAMTAYDRALALTPDSARSHHQRGWLLLRSRRFEEALAALDRAVALDSKTGLHHFNRARALLALHRGREAFEAFDRSLEAGYGHPYAMNHCAWVLATSVDADLRDSERAVELAKRAVDLRPKDGNLWNTYGVALHAAGRWEDALRALEESMARGSGGTAFDFFFVAMARQKLGQDDAREWYDKAVAWMEEHKPDDEELKRFRAEAEEVLGIEPK